MCVRKTLICFLLVAGILTFAGCNTYYYKEFIVDGKPRRPGHIVELNGLSCGIRLDAEAHDAAGFEDSVYTFRISVGRYASDCGVPWKKAIAEMNVSGTYLQIVDKRLPTELDSIVNFRPCQKYWYFSPVTISDSTSEVILHLKLGYALGDQIDGIDTTLILRRMTGKQREIRSF
jgi:hypothetical protein